MIKYVTTLNDIVGDHVKYYLYSKLNVTTKTLGELTLNSMIPADMEKSYCEDLILTEEEGDYLLHVVITNTSLAKYATIGSIIFVVDSAPVGFYNLPKIVNIKQSTNYEFRITFDQIDCNVSNMVISTDIKKFNPNAVIDKKKDVRIGHKVLQINDYNSYTPEYKKNRVSEIVPTENNPRFTSVGGVFQYKGRLMNWATQFVEEKSIEDKIIGGRFIYGEDTTSLIVWSTNSIYRYNDIFSNAVSFTSVTLDSEVLIDRNTNQEIGIIDCGDSSIIIGSPQSFRVLGINWKTLSVFDYRRELKGFKYYIDNLDATLNMIKHRDEKFIIENISTSITKNYITQLASDAKVAFSLTQYRRYLANYKNTFIFEKLSYDHPDGLLVVGSGGIGANVGYGELQAHPIGIPDDLDFYTLVSEDRLKFEFLSTSLVRMYLDGESSYVFDNMILFDKSGFKVCNTLDALRNRLRFLRLTAEPVSKVDRLIFGDGIAIKYSYDGTRTTFKQI